MQTVRINLNVNALSQYTNHNFNSMCVFNGVILGAGDTGLFNLCCGDSDNGTQIDAYFTPHKTDFGTEGDKRIRRIYYSALCDGAMTVSITGDDETTIGPYQVTADLTKGQQLFLAKTGRGLKFNYASFTFANVDGSYFSLDSIKAQIFADRGII